VGGSGAGITAVDLVLVTKDGVAAGRGRLKMSDPPATIAKRFVYPFSPGAEKRRSG
jgi:hypothetical protein